MTVRSRFSLLACASILAGSLVLIAMYLQQPEQYLLACWKSDLQRLPEDHAAMRLRQMAGLGEVGIPGLCDGLYSERPVIAERAAAILQNEFDGWPSLPISESSRIVARLAAELARRGNPPHVTASTACRRLLPRILSWPIDRDVVDGDQLVAHCEAILNACGSVESQWAVVAESHASTAHQEPDVVASRNTSTDDALNKPNHDSGDATPVPTTTPLGSPIVAPLEPLDSTKPLRFENQVEPLIVPVPRVADRLQISRPENEQALMPLSRSPMDLDLESETPELSSLPTVEILSFLQGRGESAAGEARAELARRGFQPIHFELARMLTDSRPMARLDLARQLPRMAGVDARPWLIWLSQDEDADVRRAAIASIATSSDPAMREHLRGAEQSETDEDVLRLIRQALHMDTKRATR